MAPSKVELAFRKVFPDLEIGEGVLSVSRNNTVDSDVLEITPSDDNRGFEVVFYHVLGRKYLSGHVDGDSVFIGREVVTGWHSIDKILSGR
ncbi:TPA: hypothetical protein P2I16_001596 [Aeromonas salmonicida]|nr:hypothetical protein [Aeromonas salmonicida]